MADSNEKPIPTLADKYKLKGAQQVTYAEYEAARAKQARASRKIRIPMFVKVILGVPFIVIFVLGIFYLPYIIYLVATSKSAPPPVDTPVVSTPDTTKNGK